MNLNQLLQDYDFSQPMALRSDMQIIAIFVESQELPVGFLTSNVGHQSFAMFAFDSLHRYDDHTPLYLGLFHNQFDAEQYFQNRFNEQPIFKSLN